MERIEDSLVLLESAIVRSLRRGDVTSRFSSTQQVVVLMDASKEDGVMGLTDFKKIQYAC